VRLQTVRLHLAIPRGSSSSCQAEITQNKTKKDCSWYRDKWLTMLKETPGESISIVRRRAEGVHTWLQRHDRDWLLAHFPSRNTKGQSRVQKPRALQEKLPLEDATSRDALIVSAIRSTANKLMYAEGFPKRVSISSICKEIPELRWTPRSNETTVITQALHKVIETFEAFAVRRIKYVLQKYLEEQVNPKRYEFILARAHLKNILQKLKYQGKRSVTQDDWEIQHESMKWGPKSKVRELSRTENSARSFDRKSSRAESPFGYGDSARELFVHKC
jgi:hypothetical protein